MKKLIFTILIFSISTNAFSEVDEHRKMRRILQHAFPDSMVSITEKWDGVENLQSFLDRAVVWKEGELPVTALQIRNKEIQYDNQKTTRQTKRSREALIERRENKIIRDLAIAELQGEGKLPTPYP
jgi:hypothetical protein